MVGCKCLHKMSPRAAFILRRPSLTMYSNVPLGFCLDNFFSSGDLVDEALLLVFVVVLQPVVVVVAVPLLLMLRPLIFSLSGTGAGVAGEFRDE